MMNTQVKPLCMCLCKIKQHLMRNNQQVMVGEEGASLKFGSEGRECPDDE